MKNILIYGAGSNSVSLINLIESLNKYKIVGIIGLKSELGKKILKYRVNYTDKDINFLSKKYSLIALSNTYYDNLKERIKVISRLKKKFEMPSLISPTAIINNYFKKGMGIQIYNSAVINTQNKIGNYVLINTGSIIEHDVKLGENVHISTRVTINGGCHIRKNSFIGSGSVLLQNKLVKSNSYIKMFSRII